MFVINCKNYEEISGDKIIKFIKIAEKISKKYKIKIIITMTGLPVGATPNNKILIF